MVVKHLVTAVLILLSCGVGAAQDGVNPPEGCRKSLKIGEFLLQEDATAAKRALFTLRGALLDGNREQVVALIRFPADFVLNGYGMKFETADQFMGKFDDFFTGYVIDSVRKQDPEELLAGWDGVSLSDGAVSFEKSDNGEFRISNIRSKQDKLPDFIAEFLDHRLACPPEVVEGRIVAYDWATHIMPGPENIYTDHLIVDVTLVLSGRVSQKRIRVDFLGVSNLPGYNLPSEAFEPGSAWRMYLRSAAEPPSNSGICGKDAQESIPFVDEAGREVEKKSAIKVLTGEDSPTYAGLPCFEVRKQFFSKRDSRAPIP